MTAVNNDVGAVLVLTLFLWGAVRTICRGISVGRVGWLLGAAALALVVKSTAAIALLFVPLVLVVALWRQRHWPWRWIGLGALLLVALPLSLALTWDDAAFWYRQERDTQASPTRLAVPDAPWGTHAVAVEVGPEQKLRRLLNPFAQADVERLRGQSVTVGGWIWATRPTQADAPGLLLAAPDSFNLTLLTQPITVSRQPRFVSHTYTIAPDSEKVYLALSANAQRENDARALLYLDGAFAIEGTLPADEVPRLQGGQVLTSSGETLNLIRNPSGEQAGPAVRGWVERALARYNQNSPHAILMALYDTERSGAFLWQLVAPWLGRDFFQALAWGHVRLSPLWASGGLALLGAAAGGERAVVAAGGAGPRLRDAARPGGAPARAGRDLAAGADLAPALSALWPDAAALVALRLPGHLPHGPAAGGGLVGAVAARAAPAQPPPPAGGPDCHERGSLPDGPDLLRHHRCSLILPYPATATFYR